MDRISGTLRIGGGLVGLLALGWLLSGSLGAAQAGPPPPAERAAAVAAPNAWSIRASYPISISWQALAAQGGQLYSFGGVIDNVVVDDAYKYDPAINSWTAIKFLQHPLYGASAVSDGTAIYIVNGSGLTSLYRYDPQTDSYTTLAPPTVHTHSQATVYLGGKIYRIGGFIGTAPTDSVEVYTIATNTWATAAPYLLPLREIMAVAANGYIYAAGGIDAHNYATARTARYDPATNTWDDVAVPDLPAPRWGSASALVNGRWLLAGGKESSGPTNTVLAWDLNPATGWTSDLPVPQNPRFRMGAAVLGQSLYSVGGCNTSDCLHSTKDTQQYQAPTFWDVAPTDYFYTPVLYLVTHGVVSGYSDGTFRPAANTTRGQLAKLIVLGEGWAINTTGGPHFSDVPTSYVFYPVIETAVNHGVISGYADGTFRPGADVTRGQLSKIIVNAQGWAIDTHGGPHFTDVPPGSPFYTFVETAVNHGIISGYNTAATCPSGVPCFLPGNNATRGQIAKIVYNALLTGPTPTATPPGPTATRTALPPTLPPGTTPTATPRPPTATATPVPPCNASWAIVYGASPGPSPALYGTTAVSANDVWAVGAYYNGTTDLTLTEHWDGTSWTLVPSPNVAAGFSYLWAVAAVSSNNVWAVGFAENTIGGSNTLIEHWNGTNWTIVPSPNPASTNSDLAALTVVSATDIWAVGEYSGPPMGRNTLVEHWDGGSWSIVPSPNDPSGYNDLVDIAAIAANDIWAVSNGQMSVLLHWNGAAWSIVPGADNSGYETHLTSITAIAANDVWAAGFYFTPTSNRMTLIQHWDGSQWSVVPSPNVGEDVLYGIAALGPHDIWAVGVADSQNTLTEHWNGNAWSIVPSQGAGGGLYSVAPVSARDAWAVGFTTGTGEPIIERYYCPGPGR